MTTSRPCEWTEEHGYIAEASEHEGKVMLELGEIRRVGFFNGEHFSMLTPDEAEALARDLMQAAAEARRTEAA